MRQYLSKLLRAVFTVEHLDTLEARPRRWRFQAWSWVRLLRVESLPPPAEAVPARRRERATWSLFRVESLPPPPPSASAAPRPRGKLGMLFGIEQLPEPPPPGLRRRSSAPRPVPVWRPFFEPLEQLPEQPRPRHPRPGLLRLLLGRESLEQLEPATPQRRSSFWKWLFWPESPGPQAQSKKR